ncbi:MAG TPA: hypothetical protein PLP17_00185 [Oligoflexia bacterium]|nr:hypothetical protein [Oligoflexia bacterium]
MINCSTARGIDTAQREQGAVFIEFTFSALAILFILVVTIESALAGFRSLGAQYVASMTARQLTLHQSPVRSVIGARVFAHQLALNLGVPIERPKNTSYSSYPAAERSEYGIDKADVGQAVKDKKISTNVAAKNGNAVYVTGIAVCPAEQLDINRQCTTSGIGTREQYIAVRVQTTSPFLMGRIRLNLVGFAMARNESWK